MSDPVVVYLMSPQRLTEWVDRPTHYAFREDRKLPGLQKVLFWILRKLGAHARLLEEKVSYSEIVINKNRLLNHVMAHLSEVSKLTGRSPRYIVCGPDDLFDLMDAAWREPLFQPLVVPLDDREDSWPMHQIGGAQLLVVPWIRGWFALPSLEELR